MSFITKMFIFIKNIFNNKEKVSKLELPKPVINSKETVNFTEYIKVNTIEKKAKREVETLICEGDGLGIQKKISC